MFSDLPRGKSVFWRIEARHFDVRDTARGRVRQRSARSYSPDQASEVARSTRDRPEYGGITKGAAHDISSTIRPLRKGNWMRIELTGIKNLKTG